MYNVVPSRENALFAKKNCPFPPIGVLFDACRVCMVSSVIKIERKTPR